MPVETRIRADFGLLVQEIMGRDSFGRATIKTQISKAYLVEMSRGKVPSPQYVDKFATGYAVTPEVRQDLMARAGYAVEDPLFQDLIIELRGKILSQRERDILLGSIRRTLADLQSEDP